MRSKQKGIAAPNDTPSKTEMTKISGYEKFVEVAIVNRDVKTPKIIHTFRRCKRCFPFKKAAPAIAEIIVEIKYAIISKECSKGHSINLCPNLTTTKRHR
ncbi:MAG: hypothetical protein QXJ07_04095 [Candidatus Bathyarchaeia archaeon]